METLKKFRIGVGSERFRCDDTGNLKLHDSVYFPLYREVSHKKTDKIVNKEEEN